MQCLDMYTPWLQLLFCNASWIHERNENLSRSVVRANTETSTQIQGLSKGNLIMCSACGSCDHNG